MSHYIYVVHFLIYGYYNKMGNGTLQENDIILLDLDQSAFNE